MMTPSYERRTFPPQIGEPDNRHPLDVPSPDEKALATINAVATGIVNDFLAYEPKNRDHALLQLRQDIRAALQRAHGVEP